jgi:hypothetical protein
MSGLYSGSWKTSDFVLLVVSPVVAGEWTLPCSKRMPFETGLWCYDLLCSILWYWILVKINQYRTKGIAENITSLFMLKTEIWTFWKWKMSAFIILLASYFQSHLIIVWFRKISHLLYYCCDFFTIPNVYSHVLLSFVSQSI